MVAIAQVPATSEGPMRVPNTEVPGAKVKGSPHVMDAIG